MYLKSFSRGGPLLRSGKIFYEPKTDVIGKTVNLTWTGLFLILAEPGDAEIAPSIFQNCIDYYKIVIFSSSIVDVWLAINY